MGIPELGRFFGRQEGVPDNDEDGTWIKSSATKSVFTWDNGTHTRTFYHSERRLPELVLVPMVLVSIISLRSVQE